MYYLKNNLKQIIEETILVNGTPLDVKLFENETIYNIDADDVKLLANSKLIIGKHNAKLYTKKMEKYFSEQQLLKLGDNFLYKLVAAKNCQKLIIVLGEMSLQGHNANLQYIYTPFNNFIEREFAKNCCVLSLIDTNSAFGNYYTFTENDLLLFTDLITKLLNKHNLHSNDIYIVGSSIGGTCAILLSQHFENINIISSMPLLKIDSFCIDNLPRKSLYFINGKFINNITNSISANNNYHIYCGTHDLTAHYNVPLTLLKQRANNINLYFVNDWHTATRHFKYDLLYRIDQEIVNYHSYQLNISSHFTISDDDLLFVKIPYRVENQRTYANFNLSIDDKNITYKASYNQNQNYYYIEDGVNLQQFSADLDQSLKIKCQITIIDYQNKIKYALNPLEINYQLNFKSQFAYPTYQKAQAIYYNYTHNMLSLEFALTLNSVPFIARLLNQKDNSFFPLKIITGNSKVILQLNQRRPIYFEGKQKDLRLQLFYQDGSEQLYELDII